MDFCTSTASGEDGSSSLLSLKRHMSNPVLLEFFAILYYNHIT